MSEPGTPVEPTPGAVPPRRDLSVRITLVLVTLVLVALAVLFAVSVLPRWWAHRVGAVVDGTFSAGIFAGLTCGVVFTAIPLLMLRRVVARHASVVTRVVWLVLAALFAAPNLTTLAIVIGTGNAAHAAERTFDVEAPGFRGATAVGAVIGVVFVVLLWILLAGRRRGRRRLRETEAELQELRLQAQRRDAEASSGRRAANGDGQRDAEPRDESRSDPA